MSKLVILESNPSLLSWITLAIDIVILLILLIFVLMNQRRTIMKFGRMLSNKKKYNAEKVYDREAVCEKIAVAVESLSRTKTGALITFEREDKFNDIVKSGTLINSPISPELINTIFYPGTRLHDGAVVIRRDQILAASVYYTPTTKPLTGKYGSRHRAAIGISEITDSLTVVVSEETGRISIAYKGELIPVAQDNFLRTLSEYLFKEEE